MTRQNFFIFILICLLVFQHLFMHLQVIKKTIIISLSIVIDDPSLTIVDDDPALTIVNDDPALYDR